MKLDFKYKYPKSMREVIKGKRHYAINQDKLPSVTTILSATQSADKAASLAAWRKRVGEDSATRIVDSAGARGTAMHKILEEYIKGDGYMDLTTVGQEAHNMAKVVIEKGLCNVSEIYGLEAKLYYPGLYAGATDMIAMHKGEIAICDFKQSNKIKKNNYCSNISLIWHVLWQNCVLCGRIVSMFC